MKFSSSEIALFKRLSREEPEFVAFCRKQRERWRDVLEQGETEIARGQALAYRELLHLMDQPTRFDDQ